MVLSVWDTIQKWGEEFKNFIFNHYESPVFWGLLFLIGIILTSWAYSSLHHKG